MSVLSPWWPFSSVCIYQSNCCTNRLRNLKVWSSRFFSLLNLKKERLAVRFFHTASLCEVRILYWFYVHVNRYTVRDIFIHLRVRSFLPNEFTQKLSMHRNITFFWITKHVSSFFKTFNTHNLPHTTRLKEIIIEMYIKQIRIIMRAVSILCTLLCKLPSYRDSNAYICGIYLVQKRRLLNHLARDCKEGLKIGTFLY